VSTIDERIDNHPPAAPPDERPAPDRLRRLRHLAVAAWAAAVGCLTVTDGFAFNRERLLVYICTGLLAASIGRGRRMWYVVRDWLPFALILIAYDLTRGAATALGRPTLWHWQVEMDRLLFFGTVPTVWLQERLKLPEPPWWEVLISCVYMSFFVLPYVIAGVLWLRNRDEWKAFVRLFVALNVAALLCYALVPAAPPWAAARCTPDEVAGGPSDPACNLVAAIPSLHAALWAAIAAFLWTRVARRWRPLLVAYPLTMAFTLVYTAEHFVVDVLLGWAFAAAAVLAIGRYQRLRGRPAAPGPTPAPAD